jgi:hypothetical protein
LDISLATPGKRLTIPGQIHVEVNVGDVSENVQQDRNGAWKESSRYVHRELREPDVASRS